MNDIIKTYNPTIRLWVAMVVVANGDREFGGFVYCSCQGGEREREREEETWGRKKKNIKMKQLKNKTINIWCIVK